MSSTGTQTTTFTVADIRKVVENFAADFSMMSQSTGLRSRENIAKVVYDLRMFAEYGYLISVDLILKDKDRNKIRAAVYKVSQSASGWVSEEPGNSLWPRTPGGSLSVMATLTSEWWNKTNTAKETFIKNQALNSSWDLTTENTSLSMLTASAGQRYASRGYGWERTNYSL